jgi:hypothetical protein
MYTYDRRTASAWAYHGTLAKHLASIHKHGLQPGFYPNYNDAYSEYDDGRHLFFADDPENVRGHYGDTLVRFPWPADAKPDQNTFGRILPHQFVSKGKVAPEHIEVEQDGRWVGLSDLV